MDESEIPPPNVRVEKPSSGGLLTAVLLFIVIFAPGYLLVGFAAPGTDSPVWVSLIVAVGHVWLLAHFIRAEVDGDWSAASLQRPKIGDVGRTLALTAITFLIMLLGASVAAPAAGPASLPLLLLAVPAAYREELYFRVYLRRVFARGGVPRVVAAGVSSVFFAIGHLSGGVVVAVHSGIVGLLYWIVIEAGWNAHVVAVAHVLYNFGAILVSIFAAADGGGTVSAGILPW